MILLLFNSTLLILYRIMFNCRNACFCAPEKLEQLRRENDATQHERETNLDLLLDKLRQDSTDAALHEDLKAALDSLEKIKEAYLHKILLSKDTLCSMLFRFFASLSMNAEEF